MKVKTLLMKRMEVPEKVAQRAVSYFGWFKNADMYKFREKYGIDDLVEYCKKRLSFLGKQKHTMAKEAMAC